MNNLPKWQYPGIAPVFNDFESATALEATAKVYAAMNKLIEECNTLADELSREMASFSGGTAAEIQNFKETVEKRMCHKFDDLNARMGEIKVEILKFNNEWLAQHTTAVLPAVSAADNGLLLGVRNGVWAKVELIYDPNTEALGFG